MKIIEVNPSFSTYLTGETFQSNHELREFTTIIYTLCHAVKLAISYCGLAESHSIS